MASVPACTLKSMADLAADSGPSSSRPAPEPKPRIRNRACSVFGCEKRAIFGGRKCYQHGTRLQRENFKESAKRRRKSDENLIMDRGRQRLKSFMGGGLKDISLCMKTFGMLPGEFQRFLDREMKKLDSKFSFWGYNKAWKIGFIQHPGIFATDPENTMRGFHYTNLRLEKIGKDKTSV
jgi:hypothetical protein